MNTSQKIEQKNTITYSWEKTSVSTRIILVIIALIFWAVIITSWTISPAEDGYGSHRQLGIPECQWIKESNTPCPTCGMTTAYSLTFRGRIIAALLTQPAGCILALLHLFITGLLSCIAVSGKHPVYFTAWVNYNTLKIILALAIIILIGWAYTYLRIKLNA